MTGHRISLKGFRIKDGKLQRIPGYGFDAAARIRQKKSKKVTVKRKTP